MKRSHGKSMFFLILMSTALLVGIAVAGEPATGSVNQVRDRWAQINYQTPKPQREAAFAALGTGLSGWPNTVNRFAYSNREVLFAM